MAGLLDNINNPWMSLGAGLLQAAGPHLDPSKATLGAGLSSGLNAISNQQQLQFKQALLQQQQAQLEAKNQREMQKYQQAQAEAVRRKNAIGVLQSPNSTSQQKRVALLEISPAQGAKIFGEAMEGKTPGVFEGKSENIEMYNKMIELEAKMARGEQLTPVERYQHALAQRHLAGPKMGRNDSGNPYSVPQAPLPAFPGQVAASGAQGATVGSGQGAPNPFFAPTPETQRVQPQLPAGTTAAQAAAAGPDAFTTPDEPSVSEVVGTPSTTEQPASWIVDSVDPNTGKRFSFGDEALDQRALEGASVLNAHVVESDDLAAVMMRSMTKGQRFTASQLSRLGYAKGAQGYVKQDGPHKQIVITHAGKALTENERKQAMQIQLAIDHMENLEDLAKVVPLGETNYWMRGLSAGNSNAANMGRALLDWGKEEFDLGPGTEMTPEELEMISRTQALSNVLLALYRGAQVGPLEQDRFDKQLPMPFMKRGMFMSNLANQRRSLNKAITIINRRTGSNIDLLDVDGGDQNTTIDAVRDTSVRPVVSDGTRGDITVDFNSLGVRQ